MSTVAVVLALLWVGWLVLTEWVPMFPLNDLAVSDVGDRVRAALMNYPVGLAIAGGMALGQTWSTVLATVLSGLTIVGNAVCWWLPYFGLIRNEPMRRAYQREYSRTLKVLPTRGRAVVPDLQHVVVTVGCWALFGTCLTATLVG
ncbi:hypothetical protein GCM10010174_59620 [Kutzneria viridogrisea]|uniref:Uncharacterized protein n=2 Tax=Kutzneria TaxID=43356 RepID=W5W4P3_9PSEU|nr:hypothetical protein [Kutzneria albida]AHH95446.1 hypothetical protein KALB_2077 [Kutzneria albida DSM 43870]MBA8927195.1 hypothetical protein [Kutzneria viridogrisea]